MCYKNVYAISLILLFVLAAVKGSCLEYGHSCWGAHGKRSGGSVFGGADNEVNNGALPLQHADNNNNDNNENRDALTTRNNNKLRFERRQQDPFERSNNNDASPSNNNNNINEDDIENNAGTSKQQHQQHVASKLRNLLRQRQLRPMFKPMFKPRDIYQQQLSRATDDAVYFDY